ncbi:MAG: integrase arm-type DNA-binding domain-containing protein [Proteobacteria bacterium]|nr:integrase arm-type DNA-binding domain-containing protein [Pseudomonadota bacterium]
MIVNLKDALAAGLILSPGKSREELCDGGGVPGSVPGLYIEARTTSPGEGTYYYRFKNSAGKTCHERIGRTTEITLAVARKRALEIKAGVTLGTEPRSEKLVKQEELTLGQLYHQHYAIYIIDRKKTVLRDSQLWKRVEPVFGNTKLSAVTKMDLEIFASSLLREGLARATCNLHLRLIRHMLYLACDWNMLAKNPSAKIKMFAERNQVNNYMDQPTLQRFLGAVQSYENPMIQAAILFLLSTAARTQEALKAKWIHIDLGNRTWFIPAEDAKSGKSRAPGPQHALFERSVCTSGNGCKWSLANPDSSEIPACLG